ncbi:glycosyltransferase family 2 protein [Yoonia sp.]|uniref:glycosyltransferase family 2 protein n=1 Tax=Yoonia sp. TaxID=2212373 RepID=UPI00391D3AF2
MRLADLLMAYRMRWKRRRFLFRIWRKRHEITPVQVRPDAIRPDTILCFATVRNEMARLPYFLEHYRKLGIGHFLFVDNASDDGTSAFLAVQPDASLWTTSHSYRLSRFGMDWLGWLQWQYGHGHWCLSVDADELLTYPYADSRDLCDLTRHLDQRGVTSLGAIMLELYPKGPISAIQHDPATDPIQSLNWFDPANYREKLHPVYQNLWVQGGVRDRVFFTTRPERAPTLSKVPLVRWHWRQVYVSSTHQMLPRRLNHVFDRQGGQRVTGVLLHTKFLPDIMPKSHEEMTRRQHFENSNLYTAYHEELAQGPDLWSPQSCRYEGWEQLTALGLMSKGDWV